MREHLLPLISTATLAELPGTGHLSPLEVPDQVAKHLTAFVADTRLTDPAALPLAFQDALNSHKPDRVLALYRDDAVMRTVTGEVIGGRAALRKEIEETIAADPHIANSTRYVLVTGETALVVVDWSLEVTAPGSIRATTTGTAANVAERGPDGTWRFTVLNPAACDGRGSAADR
ncbi:nuclear transport factor 2 family protein [Actinacidiphila oryziradicis]|uniref:Nuclear transport factor 2 family protein n=1 Tax=Actinacidiphila oryziradicis TaxID=2571141 RepID=A0A4U0S0G6_9ACTN|nr:nuclear transport factor 2 family protein [Actinacidiphila oryziradicis]